MIGFFKCYYCKHYINSDDIIPRCKAFPDGIPMEIFREEIEHNKPFKNDNGIMFEERNESSNKTNILDGSKEQREKIMKEFFGLKPEQSFQDIDVDDKDYICRDRKVEILEWVKSMSAEEIAEQFELRERRYSRDYKDAVEDAKKIRNMTNEEFQKHLEYLALEEKESNPDKIVLCPRCGNRLIYKENGNSYTIMCATDGCMNITCRGV